MPLDPKRLCFTCRSDLKEAGSYCRACGNTRSRAWRGANRAKVRTQARGYYAGDPEVQRARCRAWRIANRDKAKACTLAWRAANPDKAQASARAYKHANRKKALASRYRLTPAQVDEMHIKQDGRCAICLTPRKLCVDHNHATRIVRALLCHNCNTGIGQLKEDPGLLRAAAEYLERHAAK